MLKNIVISNPDKLEKIKQAIIQDGCGNLHVLSDFDRTLTKLFVGGKEIPSLISNLRDGNYLTPDYAEKARALFNKYHPIEIDPSIPQEEKKKAMREWWFNHAQLLAKSKLNKKDMERVVNSGKIELREGALEFFDLLYGAGIPLVIMSSSGLGTDAISMFLKKQGILYDNIYIISNTLGWDKKGNFTGVKEPVIHSLNKEETMIRNFPVFKKIKDRKNVLLLGDNIEDVGMIIGFDYKNLIKIGFLNKDVDKNLKNYSENFDAVVLNDAEMFCINDLLKELTGLG